MKPIRKTLHKQFSHALGCTSEKEYQRKKTALLTYFKRVWPQAFSVEGVRKRAFERMAEMEGITAEEKLEDLALLHYLIRRSIRQTTKDAALESVAQCDLPDEVRVIVAKIVEQTFEVPTV
jgi:hypothetical protein